MRNINMTCEVGNKLSFVLKMGAPQRKESPALAPSTLLARAVTTEPEAILAAGEIIEETEET